MIRKLWYCILSVLFMFISCSMGPVAGGSASEGEAKVIGIVVFNDLTPAESTSVILRSIEITGAGENILSEKTTVTDAQGLFTIEQVRKGKYVLLCDKNNSLSAIRSKITIGADSIVDLTRIQLRPFTKIKGRVLTKTGSNVETGNIKILIPGIRRSTYSDVDGFYTLSNIPQGHYDITLISETIGNYLPITIEDIGIQDTAFIRDVYFATTIKDADNVYSFYPNDLSGTFSILPKRYEPWETPEWYSGRDFSLPRYYEVVEDTALKPIWRFSLIVGVSDSMVGFYGGLESVKILAAHMVEEANYVFNDAGVFNGTIEFAIDSIYQYGGSSIDQIILPPAGIDYRLLFDEAPPPAQDYWWGNEGTIYHYYVPDIDNGLFGKYSLENLAWEFGLTRGCLPLSNVEVIAANNPVNGQQYDPVHSFMNSCHNYTTWDYYSINIINHNADEVFYKPNFAIAAGFLPAYMGATVRSGTGVPVQGAEINLYGVLWNPSGTVGVPAVLSGTTDSNGEFVFPGNPFVPDTTDKMIYSNFLVQAVQAQDTAYAWMPVNEVGSAYFANPDTSYKAILQF